MTRRDGMPETYSGREYVTHGQPTVTCPECNQPRNRRAVYRTFGGGQRLHLLHPPGRAAAHAFGRAVDAGARPGREVMPPS